MKIRLMVIFIIAIFLFEGCSKEHTKWKEVSEINTIPAYQEYVANFPNGSHLQDAEAKIDYLRKNINAKWLTIIYDSLGTDFRFLGTMEFGVVSKENIPPLYFYHSFPELRLWKKIPLPNKKYNVKQEVVYLYDRKNDKYIDVGRIDPMLTYKEIAKAFNINYTDSNRITSDLFDYQVICDHTTSGWIVTGIIVGHKNISVGDKWCERGNWHYLNAKLVSD